MHSSKDSRYFHWIIAQFDNISKGPAFFVTKADSKNYWKWPQRYDMDKKEWSYVGYLLICTLWNEFSIDFDAQNDFSKISVKKSWSLGTILTFWFTWKMSFWNSFFRDAAGETKSWNFSRKQFNEWSLKAANLSCFCFAGLLSEFKELIKIWFTHHQGEMSLIKREVT